MDRALAGTVLEPARDAVQMESAEAFQTGHVDADLELLEADGALCVVDAVLLGGFVGEEARAAAGTSACEEEWVGTARRWLGPRGRRGRAGDGGGAALGGGNWCRAGGLRGSCNGWAGTGSADGRLDALVDMGLSQSFELGWVG